MNRWTPPQTDNKTVISNWNAIMHLAVMETTKVEDRQKIWDYIVSMESKHGKNLSINAELLEATPYSRKNIKIQQQNEEPLVIETESLNKGEQDGWETYNPL